MPSLKRIFSSIGLRKDNSDQGASPQGQRASILKRSNAVLKKKPQSAPLSNGVPLYDLDEDHDDLQLGPLGPPPAHGKLTGILEFEEEMQAMIRMRGSENSSYAARNSRNFEGAFDHWPPLHPRAYQRSKPQHPPSSASSLRTRDGHSSLGHQESLGATHEEHLPAVRRFSARAAFLSEQQSNRAGIAFADPVDNRLNVDERSFRRWTVISSASDWPEPLRVPARVARERRGIFFEEEMGMDIVAYRSPYVEEVGRRLGRTPSASPSPTDSVFPPPQKAGTAISAERKRNRHSQIDHESESPVEGWLSAPERLSHEEHSAQEHRVQQNHVQAAGSALRGLESSITDITDKQLALMLSAGQSQGDELDRVFGEPDSGFPKRRSCVVCGEDKAVLDFPAKPPTVTCGHVPQTCSDCLESWMTSEVETKGTEGIKCSECPQVLAYADVQHAASASTFATYDILTTRDALGNLTDFAWCLSARCGSGQENHANANYMDCHACGYKQCLSHRIPWHADETCEEYDYRTSGQKRLDEERATEQMLNTVSKKCPNPKACGWRIQKVDGCDHMTCRRCRWEFCWECSASQKEIRRIGNTAHDVGCKYHSKNLEVTWPFNAH